MARLEKARAEWKRFDHEHKPAFGRWMAGTFGALLSRQREVEALIREKETLIEEVERELRFDRSGDERSAYARVQRRRAQPPSREASGGDASPPPREEDPRFAGRRRDDLSEMELQFLFDDFLLFMGMNPDRMSDRQYERMFAEFKAKLRAQAEPEEEPEAEARSKPRRHIELDPVPEKPGPSRIKEIYRLLVRRLHPDTRADSDAAVSALWHEVQEAYEDENLERLEMLLALTDIQSNATGETSLFQMRSVLAELRAACNAIQRNLRDAKKDAAWNFVGRKDRAALEIHLRSELEANLAHHEDQLWSLEKIIESWSSPPPARQRGPGRYADMH